MITAFVTTGLQMQVVVNNPPNLYDDRGRAAFRQLMGAFEDTEFTMGHNATMIWWDAFEDQLNNEVTWFNHTWPTRYIILA